MTERDRVVLAAVRQLDGAGLTVTVWELKLATGLTPAAVRRVLRRLEAAGRVVIRKRVRYETQGGHAHAFFGGAGVMQRTYLVVSLPYVGVDASGMMRGLG
jgi:transcription initiation factor IIE alpha subunit